MDPSTVDRLELARHRPRLLKYALAQLRDHAAAEDAVQETLTAALQNADAFAHGSSVSTWLIGILKHKIIDHYRRGAREVALPSSDDDGAEEALDRLYRDNGHLREPPSSWGDPDAALSQREFYATLEACLAELPKRTAQVFAMREIAGLSTEEICASLGITEQNCWVMLHRARQGLRKSLEARWFGPQAPKAAARAQPAGKPRRAATRGANLLRAA
jgi:RNA polymerase sigma-70 factor (ECF subfamily)